MLDKITIRGARQHNLKGIDLDIPRRALTVITGVSGSGKSSLAFDTLYAEGQRRYVESLSTYAKQFLERMEKPDYDTLEGISPSVAIEQKNTTRTSRSTVGTATEIYDYLRLLFARVGTTVCPDCGVEVKADTVQGATEEVMKLDEGLRVVVMFPLRFSEKASHSAIWDGLLALGFMRVRIGDETIRIEDRPEVDLAGEESIRVVVDRITLGEKTRNRVADSLQTAFVEGEGEAEVETADGRLKRFTDGFRCSECGRDFPEPTPNLFSFNSPYGACPACKGFGNRLEYDVDRIVPDPRKSLEEGAIDPWTKPRYEELHYDLLDYAARSGIPINVPWEGLEEDVRAELLYGGETFPDGVIPFLRGLEKKKYKRHIRFFLRRYQSLRDCGECNGSRLREDALFVTVGGKTIAETVSMYMSDVWNFFEALRLTPTEEKIAVDILRELRSRLGFLMNVGLDYLFLDRMTRTLSGGEMQRIALANSLGGRLVDTLYVLDEPTIGLHPRDNDRLIDILKRLRDQGNTVLTVEHDGRMMENADFLVELGPGAGRNGGEIVFTGSYAELLDGDTITSRCLREKRGSGVVSASERKREGKGWLFVEAAAGNNLKEIDVKIPMGTLTAITGVSGSGKSTLLMNVLYEGVREKIAFGKLDGGAPLRDVRWDLPLGQVVVVDQAPIGRTPRSNPVTYIKGFDAIRGVFARTFEARKRGYRPGRFSFNVKGGRCEKCRGEGYLVVEMHFLADLYVRCEDCDGRRFSRETLEVRYRDKNIADVLEMTVDEAILFFDEKPDVGKALWHLQEVGLGYLQLGQPATTLSGGEAQRIKIARELARIPRGRSRKPGSLYLLDEPTTGLHAYDIGKLMKVLNRLVNAGNTVVVIEHNLDVVARADWIIDLGPEGGERGGRIVAEGTPEDVAEHESSYTARYLKDVIIP